MYVCFRHSHNSCRVVAVNVFLTFIGVRKYIIQNVTLQIHVCKTFYVVVYRQELKTTPCSCYLNNTRLNLRRSLKAYIKALNESKLLKNSYVLINYY